MRIEDSRHARIEYQETGFAAPNAADLVGLHNYTIFRAQNSRMVVFRSPANNIRRGDIVVAQKTLFIDRDNNDSKHSLVAVSTQTMVRLSGQRKQDILTYNIESHEIVIDLEFLE